MNLWSKLFGAPPPVDIVAPSPGQPSVVMAIRHRLEITFYVHELDDAEGTFLTAITHGLRNQNQRELVLTLRLDGAPDVPARMREINDFFVGVQRLARRRKVVHAGGFTSFKQRGLFGRPYVGLLYADARPMRGVQVPDDALAAILVAGDDVRIAIDFGAYRVLTRVGASERCFPFPTWSAVDRASVVTDREQETALAKVPRVRMPGVSFVAEDKRFKVTLSPLAKAAGRSLAALVPGAPFALLLAPSPDADAVLFWYPGQQEPAGIIAPGTKGTRQTGSCLLIVPGGREDQIRPFEDGYTLRFSAATWSEVSFALRDQRGLSLNLRDGTRLEFTWVAEQESAMQKRALR